MALVVMTTLILGAITFGLIILESLQRSRDTDASLVSYYAADAGVERQLYAVRKEAADVEDLGVLQATYVNGSSWRAAGSGFQTTDAKYFASIQNGDFQFVDLFNPDQLNMASGIAEVRWTWTGPVGCQLEVAYAQWDPTQPSILPQEFQIAISSGGSGFQNVDPTRAYRFRFRPRRCSITNLAVRVYALPGDVSSVPFPGDITVAAEGSYKRTAQAISVTMPRLEILSGIFSYVIFSECTLFKDPNSSAPACP